MINILEKSFIEIKVFNKQLSYDEKSFFLGTFFLGSALPLSLLFFFISLLRSIFITNIYKLNKYNFLLLLCSGLMIISSLNAITNLDLEYFETHLNKNNIIFDLFNWIPMFIFFLISQRYLGTSKNRLLFTKVLIAGSIPVIISCFLQYFFKIYGPFEVLNGLIIWFQYPRNGSEITGLFSNQNYTGIWLTILLPFVILEFKSFTKNKFKKSFLALVLISTIFFTFLTYSRNALLGLLITFCIAYEVKYLIAIPFLYIFSLISFKFISNNFFQSYLLKENSFINKIFYNSLDFTSPSYSRVEGYSIALKGIFEEPVLGWGATVFPHFYEMQGGIWAVRHTHNMPLEIAFNYGLPTSLLLTVFVLLLIINAFRKTKTNFFKKNLSTIDQAWITATLIVLISHIFDLTYYDGKINILIWILLAGLKCIIDDNKNKKDFISTN